MTAHTKTIGAYTRSLHTSTDLAQSIVRLETEATRTLSRWTFETIGRLFVRCAPHLQTEKEPGKGFVPGADRGDFETAIEVLAIRGLVTRQREEWEVTPATPQRYRWSRLATLEALERFACVEHRCAYERCRRLISRRDVRFCNTSCASKQSHVRTGRR